MKEDKQITVLVAIGLLFCVLILGYAAFFAAPIQIYNITFASAEVSSALSGTSSKVQEAKSQATDEVQNHAVHEETISSALNLNTATISELMKLQGIGEVMAERIVHYREKNGPFSSVDDLLNVPGIGEKKLSAIRELIQVD